MAHDARAFHCVSGFHPCRSRHSAHLGVVSGDKAQNMRNASAIRYSLGFLRNHCLLGCTVIAILGSLSTTVHVGFVEIDPMKNKLLALGLGGTVLAILCCFTPLLPIVLTALGLTGLLGILYNDAVLLPILAGFLILTGYALWRRKQQK
ncbi:mercury resistance system transport protein MerF [Roseobacter sp. MH60115]|uniref:mercury resistance system transport protein MerF n=1 Tax=Roseobacter sp. MH60115 TaxID=2785324 RepID=UPI002DD8D7E9|nr:mercury resistance system transport protein MerF [Roseobacter sp. MH60115]